jgi:ferredoxin-NADP reductase
MARAAVLGRLTWQVGTVMEVREETATARTIVLDVPGWPGHAAGQHVDVRLTTEDGYSTQRSYSIASAPHPGRLELTVQRLEDGEVSPYLTDVLKPGFPLELRGPIGGWFVWDATTPAVAIGGGTGVVPLMSMLRYATEMGRPELLRLAVSARTMQDLPYASELIDAGALVAITREPTLPPARPTGRLTAADLEPLLTAGATYFVCGSAVFAEAVTQLLVGLDVPAGAIKVERFGPSG